MKIEDQLKEIESNINRGYYYSAFLSMGTLFEYALGHLYKESYVYLNHEKKQKLLEMEKEVLKGKSIADLGLGQLVGLFKKANTLETLKREANLPIKLFKIESLEPIVKLRNDSTHRRENQDKNTTVYSYSLLLCLLNETNMISKESTKKKNNYLIYFIPIIFFVVYGANYYFKTTDLSKTQVIEQKHESIKISNSDILKSEIDKNIKVIIPEKSIVKNNNFKQSNKADTNKKFVYLDQPKSRVPNIKIENKKSGEGIRKNVINPKPIIEITKKIAVDKIKNIVNNHLSKSEDFTENKLNNKIVAKKEIEKNIDLSKNNQTENKIQVSTKSEVIENKIVRKNADNGIQIAILYFDNNSSDKSLDTLKKGLNQMMVTDLKKVSGVDIVERESLNVVLKELKLQNTKDFDLNSAQKIGKLLGADYLMTGSFFELFNKLRIDARLIKVETGEIISSEGVDGTKESFYQLQKDLTIKITKSLNLENVNDNQSLPWKDVIDYSDAISLYDQGKKSEAKSKADGILKNNPTFKPVNDLLSKL